MYDWANSAFQTTIITAVFPLFFSDVAAAGLAPSVATARFAWATTIAVAVIAVNTNSDSVASNLMIRMVKDFMT